MLPELPALLHATVAYLADRLESENHPDAVVARAVLAAIGGGEPHPAGVQALYDVMADLAYFEGLVDGA